jgi:hypothetical protein
MSEARMTRFHTECNARLMRLGQEEARAEPQPGGKDERRWRSRRVREGIRETKVLKSDRVKPNSDEELKSAKHGIGWNAFRFTKL